MRRSSSCLCAAGALAAAAALAAGACRGQADADTGAELSVLGTVPEFAFTDQTGATVRSADLAGRVYVVDFIFTRCPTICPVTSRKMQRLGERLADRADAIRFISFSVDPEHDTPHPLGSRNLRPRRAERTANSPLCVPAFSAPLR